MVTVSQPLANGESARYAAGTHFGHEEILAFSDRPFSSVGAMDERMLHELRMAEARGPIMHLGDLTLMKPEAFVERYGLPFRQPERHTLVAGNHDRVAGHRATYASLFGEVVGTERSWATNMTVLEDTLGGEPVRVLISHAPQRDLGTCDLNLYGHHHNQLQRFPHLYRPDLDWLLASSRHYSVCVELVDYRPRTLDELHALRDEDGRDLH